MNVSILRRIAAIESIVQKPEAAPSLIQIDFDERRQQWSITETYTSGTGKNQTFKRKEYFCDKLKQYCFPATGNARVIMDTYASPDPDIHGNLFCFDLAELRRDMKEGDTGGFSIEAIRDTDTGRGPPMAEITIVTR